MSKLLQQFLSAWLDWVEAGACEAQPFQRGHGLCANFDSWLDDNYTDHDVIDDEINDLIELFTSEGLSGCYPFDSQESFILAHECREQHLNEKRLAWVRSKVKQHAAA